MNELKLKFVELNVVEEMEVDKVNGIIEKVEEDGDKMVDDEVKINRKSLRREELG